MNASLEVFALRDATSFSAASFGRSNNFARHAVVAIDDFVCLGGHGDLRKLVGWSGALACCPRRIPARPKSPVTRCYALLGAANPLPLRTNFGALCGGNALSPFSVWCAGRILISRIARWTDAVTERPTATAINRTDSGLSFGPFNLLVNERFLAKEGVPVELGARALDILAR